MLRIVIVVLLFAAAGCQQQANWLQNGGMPMRVPPPATGSYQVPSQYTP